jgi:hypothetical protein
VEERKKEERIEKKRKERKGKKRKEFKIIVPKYKNWCRDTAHTFSYTCMTDPNYITLEIKSTVASYTAAGC